MYDRLCQRVRSFLASPSLLPRHIYVLVFILFALTVTAEIGWDHEDTLCYLTLAESLGKVEGYHILGTPHVKYPPGWPVMLAPLIRLVGFNFVILHLYVMLLGFLGLRIGEHYLFQRMSYRYSRIYLLLCLSAYFFWSFSTIFLTAEMAYLFWSMLALLLGSRLMEWKTARVWEWFLFSALLAITYLTRTVGIALIAATALCLLKRALREQSLRWILTLGGVLLLPACGAMLWNRWRDMQLSSQGEPYLDYFIKRSLGGSLGLEGLLKLLDVMLHNALLHLHNLGATLASTPTREAPLGLVLLLLGLVTILGYLKRLWTDGGLAEWYTLAYSALLLVWPYTEETARFWLPLLPLVAYYCVEGLLILEEYWLERLSRVQLSRPLLALLLGVPMTWMVLQSGHDLASTYSVAYSAAVCLGLYLLYASSSRSQLRERATLLLGVLFLHNALIIVDRTWLKYDFHGYRQAGVYGLYEAGLWLRAQPKEVQVWATEPLFVHMVSGKTVHALSGVAARSEAQPGTDALVLFRGSEPLLDPAMLEGIVKSYPRVATFGDAAVYRIPGALP